MIKKNNQTIDKIYKGSVEIAKIYKGSTLVYENYRDMVVSGNDAINITKAKANSLNYLKRFGKCEQNGTPTPDSPVDIMCNNGALKYGVLGKNLFDDSHWGETLTSYNLLPFGSTSSFTYGIPIKGGQTYTGTVEIPSLSNLTAWGVYGKYENDSGTQVTFSQNTLDLKRTFTISSETDTKVIFWMYISRSNTWTNAGLTSTDQVKIQIESGSTATAFESYKGRGIYADGTPEVLTVQGKNLFGLKQWLDSLNITYTQQGEKFTITSNGSLYTNPWVFSDTDVKVKFSCKSFTNETTTKVRITFLDTGDNIVSSRYADDVLTSNVTASKCRFDWSRGGTFSIEEAQIELGSTATAYEPYSAQTASVENLLAVGNYKDEQDIISGTVTRKCGIKVLNGSENWTYDSRYSRFYTTISDMQASTQVRTTTVNVTHYICIDDGRQIQDVPNNSIYVVGNDRGIYIKTNEYTTVTSYKQFLADQYNAGTPVIVLYPLATEETESVTAQPVNIQKGTNTIQVTQASIHDLELEIKYKGK